jgi:hypothetical protein
MGLLLLIILLLVILGSAPVWPYSRTWGYGGPSIGGLLLLLLIILLLTETIPWGWGPRPVVVAP